jgi:hypothetical protein
MRIKNFILSALISIAVFQLQAVTLRVQPDVALELRAGPHAVSDINRQRYFRTYHIPGMYSDEQAAELNALGISPARGTGPYLGHNGGDAERAGWSPEQNEQFEKYAAFYRNAKKRYPGARHAMAGGNYPVPQKASEAKGHDAVDATMKTSHRQGVHPDDFDYCINLIDHWLETIRQGGGSLPSWFSPINEPDACWKNTPDPVQDHAEFARKMALALKNKYPEVNIAGPCTAWGHPGGDWGRWSRSGWERKYIETAGDVLGAYDFHIYSKEYWAYSEESPAFDPKKKLASPNLYEGLKSGNPYIWDFGKAEAYLDLVYAHHQATWGTPSLPVIISEFGRQGITPQKGPWASDYLYYLYGTTVTRMWMNFMDRPEIELTVPFILPWGDVGYARQRGQAIYTRPEDPSDSSLIATPLLGLYKFFKGLEGQRVACEWTQLTEAERQGLFALAVRKGEELRVLLHNALPKPLELNLDAGIPEARVARMRWEGAVPADFTQKTAGQWRLDFQALETIDPSSLVLAGEETAIVKFKLSSEQPMQKMVSERFYSSQTLADLYQQDAELTIRLPEDSAGSATLVPSVSAPKGFVPGTLLTVEVNGSTNSADLGYTEGIADLLAPVHFQIPDGVLKPGDNTFKFSLKTPGSKWNAKIATLRVDLRR